MVHGKDIRYTGVENIEAEVAHAKQQSEGPS